MILAIQLARVVNEVYHLYNRHQQPFVMLCVNLDHGMYGYYFSVLYRCSLIAHLMNIMRIYGSVALDIHSKMILYMLNYWQAKYLAICSNNAIGGFLN